MLHEEYPVRSAFIRKIGIIYADTYGEIHVTMARRVTYVYIVPQPSYWDNFKRAASKGRYYNRVIKRRFDYSWKY
jgi:hypothetical protein